MFQSQVHNHVFPQPYSRPCKKNLKILEANKKKFNFRSKTPHARHLEHRPRNLCSSLSHSRVQSRSRSCRENEDSFGFCETRERLFWVEDSCRKKMKICGYFLCFVMKGMMVVLEEEEYVNKKKM